MAKNKAIFITGTGRSGTNIFKEILSSHSRIATLPFEYRFTVDPRGVLDFYNSYPSFWTPYWADYKIKDLELFLLSLATKENEKGFVSAKKNLTPSPYAGWELNKWIPDYDKKVKYLIASLVEFEYKAIWPGTPQGIESNSMYFSKRIPQEKLTRIISEFLDSCFTAICEKQHKEILVEDNTHSLLFAEALSKLLPESKLIHIVRDPRDVIASLVHQRWAPNRIDECLAWYLEVMNTWFEQRKKIPTNFFTEIRFEDLVNTPSETLKSITSFAKIEFQDILLQTDLSKNNIGRYKTEFSENELIEINIRLEKILTEYEYQR